MVDEGKLSKGRWQTHVGDGGGGELVDHVGVTDDDLNSASRRGLRAVRMG